MRQLVFIGLAGAIALTVASCSSDSGSNVATTPSPVASAPVATKPATSQPFGTKTAPLVAQQPPAGTTIPGLIRSTNGDQRAKEVQASIDALNGKGKNQEGKDPFAGLPPKLPKVTPVSRQNVPTVNQLPTPPKPTTTAFNPKTTPLPPKLSEKPSGIPVIKTLPPLPTATLANAVEVSGVVIVGGVPQAIVKAPNEESSRSVRVGQRLSNGQVLVKRIEMNGGTDPIVILEENGVEVARGVGSTAQAAKPA